MAGVRLYMYPSVNNEHLVPALHPVASCVLMKPIRPPAGNASGNLRKEHKRALIGFRNDPRRGGLGGARLQILVVGRLSIQSVLDRTPGKFSGIVRSNCLPGVHTMIIYPALPYSNTTSAVSCCGALETFVQLVGGYKKRTLPGLSSHSAT